LAALIFCLFKKKFASIRRPQCGGCTFALSFGTRGDVEVTEKQFLNTPLRPSVTSPNFAPLRSQAVSPTEPGRGEELEEEN
jgi:hypothetical protein